MLCPICKSGVNEESKKRTSVAGKLCSSKGVVYVSTDNLHPHMKYPSYVCSKVECSNTKCKKQSYLVE